MLFQIGEPPNQSKILQFFRQKNCKKRAVGKERKEKLSQKFSTLPFFILKSQKYGVSLRFQNKKVVCSARQGQSQGSKKIQL